MSTAASIVPHTQHIAQESPPLLEGVDLGIYTFRINGECLQVYGRNYLDALKEAHRKLNEYRSIPVYRGDSLVTTIDWYTCHNCGKSVDVGADCPVCAGELVFASGIDWEVES